MTVGFCVKCNENREILFAMELKLSNGKEAAKGICSGCKTDIFAFVQKNKTVWDGNLQKVVQINVEKLNKVTVDLPKIEHELTTSGDIGWINLTKKMQTEPRFPVLIYFFIYKHVI